MIPLPDGYDASVPTADDIDGLVTLVTDHRIAMRGSGGVDREVVEADVIGPGSWTRRQLVVRRDGVPVAWALVHDRAAGRTDVRIFGTGIPAEVGAALIEWQQETALQIAAERELDGTQLDQLIDEADTELAALLSAAGYEKTRTWFNMTRPARPDEELPAPREGVTIRQVDRAELADGTTLPLAEDLQIVHRMLEESFQDHFNSYRESVRRVRPAAPGGPRPPLGPLVAGVHRRGDSGRRGGQLGDECRRRRRRGQLRRLHRRPLRRPRARRRQGPAVRRHRRRRSTAAATGSASRSTRTPRPRPTSSTCRWAGPTTTPPSRGTSQI